VQADANWRIGLNVKPREMAQATTALTPLLNQYGDIDHMKFLGPGTASKSDSVIVYLNRAGGYEGLKQAVLDAVAGIRLEPRVGAMWDEIASGVGVAAEPPMGSFTSYRCVVVYLSFLEYRHAGGHTLDGFRHYLRLTFPMFGLDYDRPHLQGPLGQGAVFDSWWRAFRALHRVWQG
jgi:hypothetical protein